MVAAVAKTKEKAASKGRSVSPVRRWRQGVEGVGDCLSGNFMIPCKKKLRPSLLVRGRITDYVRKPD